MKDLSPNSGRIIAIASRLPLAGIGGALPLYLGAGWIHLPVYALAAAVASPLFCTLAFLIHMVTLLFPTVFVFPVTVADANVALLAAALLLTGRLGEDKAPAPLPAKVLHSVVRPALFYGYAALLCWLLLRDSSPVQGLSLFCIVVLVHRANPSLYVRVGSALRQLAVNLALLAVSGVAGLLVLEGGARIVFGPPKEKNALWIPYEEYHFLLNPGAVVNAYISLSDGKTKTVPHRMSQQGFRDRRFPAKASGEKRILLLGDSFTMGWAVNAADTISNRLAKLCGRDGPEPITFINGGMGGAGPLQELGMLERRGLALELDSVVLQLFLQNDFDDCLMTVGEAQRCFFQQFHQIANSLYKAKFFPHRQEYLLLIHSAAYYQFDQITDFTPWASRFLSLWRFLPPAPPPAFRLFPEDGDRPPILDINRADWYPELQEGADLLVGYVERIHTLCAQRNIPFAVYCIPDFNELDETLWARITKGTETEFKSERYRAIKIVEQRLEEKGIVTFPVADALERKARQVGVGELYYVNDGHATAKGNEVVAEQIRDFLASAGICK